MHEDADMIGAVIAIRLLAQALSAARTYGDRVTGELTAQRGGSRPYLAIHTFLAA